MGIRMGKGHTRVLYVDSGTAMAGGQHSLVEILKCLDASRVLAVVCTPPRSGVRSECEDLGVRWEPLPFESERMFPNELTRILWKAGDMMNSVRGVSFLTDLTAKLRIDIVHANNFKAALVAAPACTLSGRPMVFHDRIHIRHGVLGHLVALRAARIIAVSETVATKFGGRYARKVWVIPPGIDTTRFKAGGGGDGSNLVCYVGRISEEKGLVRMVECAPAVLEEVSDAKFVIAGMPCTDRDSAYLSGLEQKIQSMGLKDKFEFPGHIEDVAGFLRRADVFVLPSVREPLGRVMIEAMLMEKPVVAFDAAGPSEVIVHGKTGFLARPGDASSLAEHVAMLLLAPGLRREVGREARKSVIHRFSNHVVAESIMNVYDEILEGREEHAGGRAS